MLWDWNQGYIYIYYWSTLYCVDSRYIWDISWDEYHCCNLWVEVFYFTFGLSPEWNYTWMQVYEMNVLKSKLKICKMVQITGNFHVHIQLRCCYISVPYDTSLYRFSSFYMATLRTTRQRSWLSNISQHYAWCIMAGNIHKPYIADFKITFPSCSIPYT